MTSPRRDQAVACDLGGALDPSRYTRVLALPHVRALTIFSVLSKIPPAGAGVALVFHAVLTLRVGYAAAGALVALEAFGTALGVSMLGWISDRKGVRAVLGVGIASQATFWLTAPWLPYLGLLFCVFPAGLLAPPMANITRQSLTVIVPAEHRRPAFALDSMSVELAYMIGPSIVVLLATRASTKMALVSVGVGIVMAAVVLFLMNPIVQRSDGTKATHERHIRKRWLTTPLVAVLLGTAATGIFLSGTEIALIAALQRIGAASWVGLLLAMAGMASLVGGFIHGAAGRSLSAAMFVGVLGLATMPIGLLGDHWWWLGLAILPANAFCAPCLAATATAASHLAPPDAVGLVMGLQGSTLIAGAMLGGPMAGYLVDTLSPSAAFAGIGLIAVVVAAGSSAYAVISRDPAAASAVAPDPVTPDLAAEG